MDAHADFAEIEREVAGLLAESAGGRAGATSPADGAVAHRRQETLAELSARLGKPPPPRKPAFLPEPCLGNNLHTPALMIEKMLELAAPAKDDVLYDLGCGDGRIAIAAARKFHCQTVGVDLNPIMIKAANLKARMKKVAVRFEHANLLTVDLTHATVVLLHLSPEGALRMKPRLQQLSKARIISYDADMGDWEPKKVLEVVDERQATRVIYLWEAHGQMAHGPADRTGTPTQPRDADREIWEDLE